MITFAEFLHGDNWTKPILPDLTKAMTRIIRSGQASGTVDSTTAIPSHQRLMMALAKAGSRGLTRAEISGLVDLDGRVLDDLLSALVRSAEVAISQGNDGRRVYRLL
jgi:hypothetical protein